MALTLTDDGGGLYTATGTDMADDGGGLFTITSTGLHDDGGGLWTITVAGSVIVLPIIVTGYTGALRTTGSTS